MVSSLSGFVLGTACMHILIMVDDFHVENDASMRIVMESPVWLSAKDYRR